MLKTKPATHARRRQLVASDLRQVRGGEDLCLAAGTQDAMKRVLFGASGVTGG
jgi:hypothetical protein